MGRDGVVRLVDHHHFVATVGRQCCDRRWVATAHMGATYRYDDRAARLDRARAIVVVERHYTPVCGFAASAPGAGRQRTHGVQPVSTTTIKATSKDAQALNLLFGLFVGGFVVLYLIFTDVADWWLLGLFAVVSVLGLAVHRLLY